MLVLVSTLTSRADAHCEDVNTSDYLFVTCDLVTGHRVLQVLVWSFARISVEMVPVLLPCRS